MEWNFVCITAENRKKKIDMLNKTKHFFFFVLYWSYSHVQAQLINIDHVAGWRNY